VSQGRNGLLVVDKPAGMTSHDVVARVRRLAGTRKVGHAGTLDPMATGVLLLGVGRATRLLGHLALAEKTYEATVRLGLSTTTDDAEGEPLERVPADHVSEEWVRDVLAGMVGELDQVPSTVSAVKVAGRRSYERARAGETVELAPRRVIVHRLDVHDVRRDGAGSVDVDLSVRCSSGTYVRAIARDLGLLLGVGGHLTRLRRTAIGRPGHGVGSTGAATLDELERAREDSGEVPLVPMGEAARRFFTCVEVGADDATAVGHGRRLHLAPDPADADPVAVLDRDGELLALYRRAEPRQDGSHAPLAVLV
jgi:tRNA pseudouridine55 synthase